MTKQMTKQEFKSRMSKFRMSLKNAVWKSSDAYSSVLDSDAVAESCLRPRHQPIVSRNVMLYLFSNGGLDAVRHIDDVEIRYN